MPEVQNRFEKTMGRAYKSHLITVMNFVGLGLLALIVVPATVVRPWQLLVVLTVMVSLAVLYSLFHRYPRVSALFSILSVTIILWIALCENIVSVDNLLGSQIARTLRLGTPLQTFVKEHLTTHKHHLIQACCRDALTYSYKPGSLHRATYDCSTCNEPYEVIVDSTGHLNVREDLMEGNSADLFIAGDSVLAGTGVPSVVEILNESLPVTAWNLSISGYGPRQKVQALIAEALSKNPKWVVIEFFAGNDLNDEVINEGCRGETFLCIFNARERDRRLLRHSEFSPMLHEPSSFFGLFDEYVENNLTLAVTRELLDHVKSRLRLLAGLSRADVYGTTYKTGETTGRRFAAPDVSDPGGNFDFVIRPERLMDWLKAGMVLTQDQYDRLAEEAGKRQPTPRVVLLYNPSAYEIYRGIKIERDEQTDRTSDFLRKALREYAGSRGWIFLDLTIPLSREVAKTGLWIYGQYDRAHWSGPGTTAVGAVLSRELISVLDQGSAG